MNERPRRVSLRHSLVALTVMLVCASFAGCSGCSCGDNTNLGADAGRDAGMQQQPQP
ncbi:MAG: hypothetical protein K1X94_25245 [Sandaracinaceae bacterium]|nr:hypothetical protein [Sandaracinaceae bacterium]